ncbi:trypsin alpha-like [Drosophila bipectinata]|uniref:trypsin alpha-like n=1 Tax=Drosophila bipectinata TaxID=42026 RepID=UPI001C8936B7|nr:trypsin alpha-like [Drosophila bipectinata]
MLLLNGLFLISCGALISAKWLPGRIVGGNSVAITSVPWQVSLQINGRHFCGGSIYREDIVITAAHCMASIRPISLSVRVGSTDSNSGGQSVRVSKILVHEDYDENTVANDVAVLRLESRLTLNASVRAIPLAYKVPRTADSARVSGWGAIGYQKPASSTLLAADVAIVDQDQCNRAYGGLIQNVMICASAPGKDSCQGDSGGPLVSGGKLVGIVSFGNGCANPNYPGVYANVAKLRSWIRNAANRI